MSRLLLLKLMIPFFIVNCRSADKVQPVTPNFTFVHGDPLEFIENTAADDRSFFTSDTRADFENYTLSAFEVISEKSKVDLKDKVTSQKDLENANATDKPLLVEAPVYKLEENAGRWFYRAENVADAPALILEVGASSSLEVVSLQLVNADSITEVPVVARHFSRNEAKGVFSLLLEVEDEGGTHLVAMYFTKLYSGALRRLQRFTSENFAFVLGRSLAIGWRDQIDFHLCGTAAVANKTELTAAIKDWETSPGKIGALPYSITVQTKSRPYSDVNQTCIQLISQYAPTQSASLAKLGQALPIINQTTQEIVAGQSFIYLSEHQKSFVSASRRSTVIHEVGHLLGLGHEFARDEATQQPIYPSVMGYSDVPRTTSRDRDAIEALYREESASTELASFILH